jgi:PPK2 family polyphosphate:nucleotide phosphotransferase
VGLLDEILVGPGEPARLRERETAGRLGLVKDEADDVVGGLVEELRDLQDRLWAENRRSLLLVLQGLDTAGKDGTIRRVLTGVNPQACRVAAFDVPVGAELERDFLWRVHAVCPGRGELGIFNRSHYEDVGIVRVKQLAPEEVWRRRYRHIREFERLLADEGTTVVKVFLHISKEEQRQRLQARLDDPRKTWKFRLGDLEDRTLFDEFLAAYDEAIGETSTEWAPWHVVPADRKWVRDIAVATLLVDTLRKLDPRYPRPPVELKGVEVE